MNDLLKKLNTLAKAKLNDLTPNLPSFERTPNFDRQINDLRQRINDALDYEDQLQRNAQALRDEVTRLDSLADEAVANGRDADARYLLDQLKRAEQRMTIAESELRAHQRSAEELIQRVNMLEATVADAKAAEQNSAPPVQSVPPARSAPPIRPAVSTEQPPLQSAPIEQTVPTSTPQTTPASTVPQTPQAPAVQPEAEEYQSPAERFAAPARENAQEQAEKTRTAVEQVSDMLREAQEKTQSKIESLSEILNAGLNSDPAASAPNAPASTPQTEAESDNSVMMPRPKKTDEDDDLAQRLRRLSKPE